MKDEYLLNEDVKNLVINCLAASKCDTVAHLNNTQRAITALQALEKVEAKADAKEA